jgi:hypothetical protein
MIIYKMIIYICTRVYIAGCSNIDCVHISGDIYPSLSSLGFLLLSLAWSEFTQQVQLVFCFLVAEKSAKTFIFTMHSPLLGN